MKGLQLTNDPAVITGKIAYESGADKSENHNIPPSLMEGKKSPIDFKAKKKDINIGSCTIGNCNDRIG